MISNKEPVFFRQSDYDANCESRSDTALTTYDVCMSVSKIVGKSLVDGAQNIRGVWRIYLSDRPARLNLCVKRLINIKRVSVPVFDKNPSITKQLSPDEKREKIPIKDILLSIASQEIEQYLKDKNVGLVTDVKFAHERDPNGQLTSFKNGDRYIYAIKA